MLTEKIVKFLKKNTSIIIALIILGMISLKSGCFLLPERTGNGGSSEVLAPVGDGQNEEDNNDVNNPGIIGEFRENSIKGPQYIDIDSYQLKITGLVTNPIEYTYVEVINNHKSYKKVVTLNCVEGWSVTTLWEGVLVKDLIEETKPSPAASVIIFHAYDGYSTSFPIEYIIDNDIMMAYKLNDETLPTARGFPFELVAENKWGYKWIRWVTEIELSDDINYRGYWESWGYSNSGNLDGSED